jgi:hypothetical protein
MNVDGQAEQPIKPRPVVARFAAGPRRKSTLICGVGLATTGRGFMDYFLGPEGALTNQPRATPWESECPETN